MFQKKYRLKKSEQITRVVKNRAGVKSTHLLLKYVPSDLGYCRVAIGIAKQLKIKGVKRNRFRRQLAHAIKAELGAKVDELGYDFFFILLAIPDAKVYQVLQRDINSLIQKFDG
ncbi:ribonuclease P protein component [Candidatus Peregrinibacteria bacterium CG11_big_fil_rev_8_21_14_0_20_41_10]|nr:MAG: ribonuclease P protein component [Candidatus Peregrinibacteria bacterium CG11_big_fil_rev_8_21_14_0_20_41_10]PIZ76565.1 MAG: ribonuclease P protein component [Candidatus Peregrinibacteria bacterium CG_4_10_14_0_2_um_filter_41_8]PJC37651.1 MAG: ribonuclease P protein component [Candidatus Peregrinibacteria bacterium CG_4_9_14_0_2_um_filter_41_14]